MIDLGDLKLFGSLLPVVGTFLLPHPCLCSLARGSHPFPVSERGGRTISFLSFAAIASEQGPGSFPRRAAWPLLQRCLAYALGLISICEVWSVFSCLPQHHALAHHHVLSSHAFQCLPLQPAIPHDSCQGKTMTCYCFLPTSTKQRAEPWWNAFVSWQNQEGALGFQQTQARPPWLEWRVKSSNLLRGGRTQRKNRRSEV